MARIENDLNVNNIDKEIKPLFRLTLKKNDKFFGPGIATLLHYVDEYHSIQSSCNKMGMSYSKAWTIIKKMERELGFKVLDTISGGAKGGQSTLTADGKKFLDKYDKVLAEIESCIKKIYTKYDW